MKPDNESSSNPGKLVKVPFRFDDALRRAMRVKQPKARSTNEDYRHANEKREKGTGT